MPGSATENKFIVREWFNQIQPRLILDVGPGCGTYSTLLRSGKPTEDNQKWYGVEVFEPYIEKYNLKSKYEHIIVQDVKEVDFSKLPTFDLIIAGDILEHLEKQDAITVIERLKQHTKNLIISIPIIDYPQGPSEGNVHETHLSNFNWNEMKEIVKPKEFLVGTILGYYWWQG